MVTLSSVGGPYGRSMVTLSSVSGPYGRSMVTLSSVGRPYGRSMVTLSSVGGPADFWVHCPIIRRKIRKGEPCRENIQGDEIRWSWKIDNFLRAYYF